VSSERSSGDGADVDGGVPAGTSAGAVDVEGALDEAGISLFVGAGSDVCVLLLLSSHADKANIANPVKNTGKYFRIFFSFYNSPCYG